MRSFTIVCIAALALVSCVQAVSIPEADNDLPWVEVPDEASMGCWNVTDQLASDLKIGAQYIATKFSTMEYINFIKFQIGFVDPVSGPHLLYMEVDVWYNQIPTSNGPITFTELFQIGNNNFTKCRKRNPYRPSDLTMTQIPSETIVKLARTFGLPGDQFGCDYTPQAVYLARSSRNCVPIEMGLLLKDNRTDEEADAKYQALGFPLHFFYKAFLLGAALGLPEDIQVTTTNIYKQGERDQETLLYNPVFLMIASQQAKKRSDKHLPLSYPLVKIIGHANYLKAAVPQFSSGIDWLVEGQMRGLRAIGF